MFERFTDSARRVVVLAQEGARMLSHGYIGTEHLLLGLVHEGEGMAAQVLEGAGLTLDRSRQAVEQLVDVGRHASGGHIPFTPRAKTALELSLREAMRVKDRHIGTQHLLLGLLQEGGGVAIQVIERLGADPDRLRDQVMALVSGAPSTSEREPMARGETSGGPGRTGEGSDLLEENANLRSEVVRLRAEAAGLRADADRLRARLRQQGIDPASG
jgi:ATP-dependent Clp protease ATP-binding subunit ClpC